ncbi:hypothetical protein VHUM_03752 [Vanrija humicola]|uniref:Exocyst complex component Sec10-like alpha-helical bundle domain-containing protein n=1 Tax=Vanrija humicola TaxID=5417 RepID=A0A7D8UZR3_VANHU|nr:hypothetical protein VHUM_03752 [Vanrija humicola]
MDKWAPLAPSKPGGSSSTASAVFSGFGVLKPSKAGPSTSAAARARAGLAGPRIGRWPEDIVTRIVGFLPVHAIPNVARGSRALARVVRDEETWRARCAVLGITEVDKEKEPPAHARKTSNAKPRTSMSKTRPSFSSPKASTTAIADDDFGDFGEGNDTFEDVEFGDFAAISPPAKGEKSLLDFDDVPLPSRPAAGARSTGFFALAPSAGPAAPSTGPGAWYNTYKRKHVELVPLCLHLRSSPSPSATLSLLFPPDAKTGLPPSLEAQGELLLVLLRFLSPRLQPLPDWGFLRQSLLAAADRFDSTCLVAFETADSRKDEAGMHTAAEASWRVWDAGGGERSEWECGRVWVEKREVFYDTAKWDASENIIKVPDPTGTALVKQLDFTPMDAFMNHVLESFRIDAETAVRVFPAGARVVHSFAERLADEVIGEYIQTLLGQTRVMSPDLFLRATAASFIQAWKLVDVSAEVLGDKQTETPPSMIETVVYNMFESHMDEYLDEETEWVKTALDGICNAWDAELGTTTRMKKTSHGSAQPQFLTASNPDQVKRNVLAGFRDVLLLPVTIVPRAVTFGATAIAAGGAQAVSGLSMLNPQKWAASTTSTTAEKIGTKGKVVNGEAIFDVSVPGPDDEVEERDEIDELSEKTASALTVPLPASVAPSNGATPEPGAKDDFDRLQLLVSLDTALELIHADRESLKRTETFGKYPAKTGTKVREAIEEIFILLLKAVGDRHIAPGFRM